MVHLKNFEEGYEWMGTDPEFIDWIGEIIAKRMNRVLFGNLNPINLAYEKKYLPGWNLIRAKNYEGYLLGPGKKVGDKGTYLDRKGVSDKKRGYCPFYKELGLKVSEKLSIESDVEGAWNYAIERLVLLKRGVIPFGQLIKTQQLSKSLKSYGSKITWNDNNNTWGTKKVPFSPAVKLARRIAFEAGKKDFETKQLESNKNLKEPEDPTKWELYEAGSIIKYVIVQKNHEKKNKQYALSLKETENPELLVSDKAEDPFDALRQKLPIDYEFYFEETARLLWKKFAGPFGEIYTGKDSKKIRKESPFWQKLNRDERICRIPFTKKIQKTSSIIRFCVETKHCEICKVSIHPGRLIYLCDNCLKFEEFHRSKAYDELGMWDDTLEQILESCKICVGGDMESVKNCENLSCGNYQTRLSAKTGIVEQLGKCEKLGF